MPKKTHVKKSLGFFGITLWLFNIDPENNP
jgi:hypothetical protein